MPSFIKSKAGRGQVAEALILPLGRIVADHAADEGIDPLVIATSLAQEKFSGYILIRDMARTRQGVIILVAGEEAGTILQVGREIFTGTEAAKRITTDYPAVRLAITAHDLGEPEAMAASAPLVGVHMFRRLPSAVLNINAILEFWQNKQITGLLWAGNKGKRLAVYFYKGMILGEIKQGDSKLHPGTVGLLALWKEDKVEAEGFVR